MALTYTASTRLVARALGLSPAQLDGSLRPARMADLDAILAFRRRHIGATIAWDDAAYIPWRYRLGREGAGFGDLWLLQPHDEPLALLGLEDIVCQLDGTDVAGVRSMDLLARADLQGGGVGVWMNQAAFQRHAFVLAMGANQNSAGIVKRLYQPLTDRETRTHPIDLGPFVRRRTQSPLAAAAAAGMGNLAFAALRTWRHLAAAPGLRIEPVRRFDAAVQAAQGAGQAVVRREPGYLNRRLLDNPRCTYRAAAAFVGQLCVGYLAWTMRTHGGEGSELLVADWQASSEAVLGSLLSNAVVQARRDGCVCARVTLQDDTMRRAARRLGFVRFDSSSSAIAGVHAEDPALLARLTAARWSLTDISDDIDGF